MAPAIQRPLPLDHQQQHVVRHAFADQRIERAGEVGAAPFARTGLHVEVEEGVPGVFGDVPAGQRVDRDALDGQRLAPFALDRLAVARVQGGEKIVEAMVALIVPVELLVGPLQKTVFGQKLPFAFAGKGDVDR